METMVTKERAVDAIVVGSGPGGATVARELTRGGQRVLILERGSGAPIRGTLGQFVSMVGMPGRSLLLTKELLAVVRGITTGGSSVFYYATAFDPPLAMLESHGLDIADEIAEAKKELPIAPLADGLVGPMATRIMSSARDLGYNWQKLPKLIYQDKCSRACWRCNYGCPYGAKWNARMFVDDAVSNGATLLNGAKVEKVIVENGTATGVEFKKAGIQRKAFASKVVVSAGGIGSPVILRASGLRGAGYDYFFDPLICVMGTVNGITGGKEVPMAAGVHMEEEGYLMTDMTVPAALHMGLTAEVFELRKLLSHPRTLQIMVKAKDSLGGRLTARGGVRKPLTREDKQKLLNGYERAKAILVHAGAKDIYKSWYLASHPGATVKVGDLVDTNLQTEVQNLYVCDCSVIPEAWGLPPTLTLIGLGKRLAKHLAGAESESLAVSSREGPVAFSLAAAARHAAVR
jgi:choline dehydrogenase-like flavoprotein